MSKKSERKRKRFLIKLKLLKMAAKAFFKGRKSLFLDCGSNLGQGYTFFKRYLKPFLYDAVLIEPNPNCVQTLKQKFASYSNVEILEGAAWTRNEKLKLFGLVEVEDGATSTGASVVSNHNSGSYDSKEEQALEVDAFSLAELVERKARTYDSIIVKLDIESSEYTVLQDLIETQATQYIEHLFIEFHSQYFDASEQQHYVDLEKQLIGKLESMGVGVTLWF